MKFYLENEGKVPSPHTFLTWCGNNIGKLFKFLDLTEKKNTITVGK